MNDWSEAEQRVERAHEYFELGRWDDAETELRSALSVNPYQPEWHFNLGLTLDAAGRFEDAATAFDDAFELDTQNAHAAMLSGAALTRAGRHEKALERLDAAASIDPMLADVQVFRIEALAALGRHEEAEEAFYLGQECEGPLADLFGAMAESLLDRNLLEKAVWCLREASRLNPDLPRIEARLAAAYAMTGRHERARQLYLRELRRDPGDVETLLDLGDLLVDMHRPTEAREKFLRVLELEPDNADAHAALGSLYEDLGATSDAIAEYEMVVRLDAEDGDARRRLASLLLRRRAADDEDRARRLIEAEQRALRVAPESFDESALDDLGCLLLDAGRAREAVRTFARLAERSPEDPASWHHLAVAQFEAGMVDEGLASSRRALRLDPRSIAAMHNLAVAHIRQGRIARARYWIRQALVLDRDDPGIRRLRAVLVWHAGRRALRWGAGAAVWGVRYAFGVLVRPSRRVPAARG